jgi:hypothetical protein
MEHRLRTGTESASDVRDVRGEASFVRRSIGVRDREAADGNRERSGWSFVRVRG